MGFSISDLFGDAQKAVSNTVGTLEKTGVPAVLAGLEQYGADQLTSMAKANDAVAQQGVTDLLNSPSANSGIVTALKNAFSGVATSTVMKNYGGYIVMGIGGLLLVGLVIGRD